MEIGASYFIIQGAAAYSLIAYGAGFVRISGHEGGLKALIFLIFNIIIYTTNLKALRFFINVIYTNVRNI